MPQLDVVSFFNQIAWLTVAFLALLPLFYLLVSAPYSQTLAARSSLARSLGSVAPSPASAPSGPKAGQPIKPAVAPEFSTSCASLSEFRARAYSALR
uniref:ATP synthase F0 subunit 8 n=1 Tax=Bigelowiella natans TaxID=227086 RepID=E9NZY1_BIGNA|nr:ATP synthase F0 subunit 8 [Bigelowiella natans]